MEMIKQTYNHDYYIKNKERQLESNRRYNKVKNPRKGVEKVIKEKVVKEIKKVEPLKTGRPKSKHYINDKELYREIIISKGRGRLSPRAGELLYLIGVNVIRVKQRTYKTIDDRNDCLQGGMLQLLQNWKSFDHLKYESPFVYYTEVFKRGIAQTMNQLNNVKKYDGEVFIMLSIDYAQELRDRNRGN